MCFNNEDPGHDQGGHHYFQPEIVQKAYPTHIDFQQFNAFALVPKDLLFLVCFYLSKADLLQLRLVCATFQCPATHAINFQKLGAYSVHHPKRVTCSYETLNWSQWRPLLESGKMHVLPDRHGIEHWPLHYPVHEKWWFAPYPGLFDRAPYVPYKRPLNVPPPPERCKACARAKRARDLHDLGWSKALDKVQKESSPLEVLAVVKQEPTSCAREEPPAKEKKVADRSPKKGRKKGSQGPGRPRKQARN
ncbi:hypothetical protein BC940DRAFT_354130 [Gongronella butleri]|nr:hypothetical protein BC940DRAFT_354130 [Gongronella butleri]